MTIIGNFNDILAAFGQKVGIPDLQFDDDGQCVLRIDELTITLELNDNATQIIVSSPFSTLDAAPSEPLLLRYLALNYLVLIHGTGGIGYDDDTRQLVFVDRIPLLGLDDDLFESSITNVVERLEALQNMLESVEWRSMLDETKPKSTTLTAQLNSYLVGPEQPLSALFHVVNEA